MISKAASVDEFLAALPEGERVLFGKIRAMFKRAGANVDESMKYKMPTYLVAEKMVGAFNQQKNYLCLYVNPAAVDPHRKALKALGLDCGKSCIRFRKPGDLPLDLAEKLIAGVAQLAGA